MKIKDFYKSGVLGFWGFGVLDGLANWEGLGW